MGFGTCSNETGQPISSTGGSFVNIVCWFLDDTELGATLSLVERVSDLGPRTRNTLADTLCNVALGAKQCYIYSDSATVPLNEINIVSWSDGAVAHRLSWRLAALLLHCAVPNGFGLFVLVCTCYLEFTVQLRLNYMVWSWQSWRAYSITQGRQDLELLQ